MCSIIITPEHQRALGGTGLRVPPVVFDAGVLGNARRVIPEQTKFELFGEWIRCVAPPVFIHVGGERGVAERSLEFLGRALRRLDILMGDVVIDLEVPVGKAALEVWRKACSRLGSHPPLLVSVDARAVRGDTATPAERERRVQQSRESLRALADLKAAGDVAGVGLVESDWRAASEIAAEVELDWLTLVGGFTIMQHPPEPLEFMARLAARPIPIIVSDVFGDGFLVGGDGIKSGTPSSENPIDRAALAWRKAFVAVCHGHGVTPAHACVQFALRGPGVVAAMLESTDHDSAAKDLQAAVTPVPDALWDSLKEEGLLEESYRDFS